MYSLGCCCNFISPYDSVIGCKVITDCVANKKCKSFLSCLLRRGITNRTIGIFTTHVNLRSQNIKKQKTSLGVVVHSGHDELAQCSFLHCTCKCILDDCCFPLCPTSFGDSKITVELLQSLHDSRRMKRRLGRAGSRQRTTSVLCFSGASCVRLGMNSVR